MKESIIDYLEKLILTSKQKEDFIFLTTLDHIKYREELVVYWKSWDELLNSLKGSYRGYELVINDECETPVIFNMNWERIK